MSSAIFLGLIWNDVIDRRSEVIGKRNGYIFAATLIFDLGLFITSIVMGSLAAQGKLFSAKQSLGAMIGFFLGGFAFAVIDIGGIVWACKRGAEANALETEVRVQHSPGAIIHNRDDQGKLPEDWFYVQEGENYHYYHLQTYSRAFKGRPEASDGNGPLPKGWSYVSPDTYFNKGTKQYVRPGQD